MGRNAKRRRAERRAAQGSRWLSKPYYIDGPALNAIFTKYNHSDLSLARLLYSNDAVMLDADGQVMVVDHKTVPPLPPPTYYVVATRHQLEIAQARYHEALAAGEAPVWCVACRPDTKHQKAELALLITRTDGVTMYVCRNCALTLTEEHPGEYELDCQEEPCPTSQPDSDTTSTKTSQACAKN